MKNEEKKYYEQEGFVKCEHCCSSEKMTYKKMLEIFKSNPEKIKSLVTFNPEEFLEKLISFLEENIDDEGDFYTIENTIFDINKILGYDTIGEKDNSLAGMAARYHEARDERYNPSTKRFEKY